MRATASKALASRQAKLFERPRKIPNGVLTLKEEPGLGLTLSERALRKFGERLL